MVVAYADPELARRHRVLYAGFDYATQPKEYVPHCNLCGARSSKRVGDRDRYGFAVDVGLCLNCGLIYFRERMTAAAFSRFYATGAYRRLVSAFSGMLIDELSVAAQQETYAVQLAEFVRPLMVGCQSILDVGGSTGAVAAAIKKVSGATEATVLDPATAELSIAEDRGLDTILAQVEEWEPDRCWDVVCLIQTLEHLGNPLATLQKLRGVTRHLFLFDIVDTHLAVRDFGTLENTIKIDHPFYFTAELARRYARESGFSIVGQAQFQRHVVYACR